MRSNNKYKIHYDNLTSRTIEAPSKELAESIARWYYHHRVKIIKVEVLK